MESRSLYIILGVNRDATTSEIKKAYKKRVSRLHPDVSGRESYDEFVEVTNAYEILSNPEKRKKYDKEGITGDTEQNAKQTAHEIIIQWFKSILKKAVDSKENLDIVNELRKSNKLFYSRIQSNIKKSQKSKKKLIKIRKRLKRKKKKDYCLLQNEIEKELLASDMSIAQAFRDMKVCKIVQTILEDYEFDMNELEGESNG